MIVEIDEIKNNDLFEGDLCLIGSGPATLSILHSLKKTNLKIIIIPGGEFNFNKKNQNFYRGIIDKKSYHEPLTENRFREFGGTGNYWGGRCVPLDEIDLQRRKWIKNSGWPIKFREIVKYYKKASKFLDINPYNHTTNFNTQKSQKIIKELDDTYLTSNKLESWSPILNFRNKFKDTIKRENIKLLNNSHVLKINTSKQKVIDLDCISLKKKFKVKCKNYVLGCGGIENPRILLNSKNKFHPRGIGNSNDLVGRFYMAHHAGIFLNFDPFNRKDVFYNYFKDKNGIYQRNRWWLNTKFQKEKKIGNSIFFLSYTKNSKDMGSQQTLFDALILFKQINSNKRNIFKFKTIIKLIKVLLNFYNIKYIIKFTYLRLQRNRIPSILPDLSTKYFGIYHQVEQTPCYDSRLTLSKKRDIFKLPLIKLSLKFNSMDTKTILKSHKYLIKKIKEFKIGSFQKKNTKQLLLKHYKNQIKSFNSMAHHMGTTRMGSSKKNGVVDKNCKVFGTANLFIVGSSVFPTGGHANPTFTIIALSLRLGNLIKKIKKNVK
tara:strand:+ start:3423 stop:5060 length:1638 start_codon:yes stop_codon:yes gene_type:complete